MFSLSEGQWYAWSLLKSAMEDREVNVNYKLWHPVMKKNFELDIYIPSLALALEYQGSQHFQLAWGTDAVNKQQDMDRKKRLLCQNVGITLVDIPYW